MCKEIPIKPKMKENKEGSLSSSLPLPSILTTYFSRNSSTASLNSTGSENIQNSTPTLNSEHTQSNSFLQPPSSLQIERKMSLQDTISLSKPTSDIRKCKSTELTVYDESAAPVRRFSFNGVFSWLNTPMTEQNSQDLSSGSNLAQNSDNTDSSHSQTDGLKTKKLKIGYRDLNIGVPCSF